VTVLDAFAVIAFLRDEPAAKEVTELLRGATVLSAVNATEVVDQLVRVYGRNADDVHADLALLEHVGLRSTPVTAEIGLAAGRLRARHYQRQAMAVSLADCVAAATALSFDRPLATADPALATLTRREGGQVHGLPDTAGRLP